MGNETRLEVLQRIVSSYDTEAGNRLEYHITKAMADEEYANKIGFDPLANIGDTTPSLVGLFIFGTTREGQKYWWKVHTETEGRVWKEMWEGTEEGLKFRYQRTSLRERG